MSDDQVFETEIDELNRRNKVDRNLANLLDKYLSHPLQVESSKLATLELIESYLAVVRSRNKVRRNWHPDKAIQCDIATLDFISKEDFKKTVSKRLRDALKITANGEKVIEQDSLGELINQITEDVYQSKRKGRQPTELEEIVNTILRANPDATGADVINEMRANPDKYGIVDIDEKNVVIRVPTGIGKQTIDKPRSLKTVHNILKRLKPPRKRRD